MKADSAFFDLATDGVEVDFARVIGELKPGAHLLALSPIATHHSNTIGIEDAGMEIRDTLSYVFDAGGNTPDMVLVTVARKPLEGTVAENVLRWGTGGLNIDGCRVEDPGGRPLVVEDYKPEICGVTYEGRERGGRLKGGSKSIGMTTEGRWPANLTHDNNPAVQSMFPNSKTTRIEKPCPNPEITGHKWGSLQGNRGPRGYDGDGSAARFFYSAPSVDDLVAYLLKLTTPPNGTVLTNCDTGNLPNEYTYVTNCGQ